MSITAILLTFNEEKNLPHTLKALVKLTDKIFIIDSYSTDKTLEIAKEYGAIVYQNKFETHSTQWAFGFKTVNVDTEWIIGLDADQELTDEVIEEIKTQISIPNNPIDGLYIARKMYFMGKWIKHGGYYPLYLLKVFKKSKMYVDEGELMEHHFYVNGNTMNLKNPLIEENRNETLEFWVRKHIRYAELQAQEELQKSIVNKDKGKLLGSQNERKLFLKVKIWQNMPLFVRPFIYFFFRYFIQLGILDGKTGLIFHFMQAFWYRFLVDSRMYEMRSQIKNNN